MHYINVITNSGNLKQPGRDTILIETTTTTTATTTTTTGVILALIGRSGDSRASVYILFCFVCLFVSCLLRDFTLASGKACAHRIRVHRRVIDEIESSILLTSMLAHFN